MQAAQAALDEDSMQVSMHGRVQKEIQTALAAERAMQEQRSQKVLHVLQDRDKIIHELHVEHGRLHAKVRFVACVSQPYSMYYSGPLNCCFHRSKHSKNASKRLISKRWQHRGRPKQRRHSCMTCVWKS